MNYQVTTASPLINIFKDSNFPKDAYIVEAVRGEVASLQIVLKAEFGSRVRLLNPVILRCKSSSLAGNMNFVGFVPVRCNTPDTELKELEKAAPGFFPDPLLEEEAIETGPGDVCPIWVTVPVSQNQEPGIYSGTANIICGSISLACGLTVIVHRTRVSEKRNLLVTNWFWPGKVASHYKMEPWSDRHWRYIETVARDLAAHRQNVIFAPLHDLIIIYREKEELRFDFERFDRWVDLFDKHGVAERIEGSHLGGREGGVWDAKRLVLNPVTIRNPDGSVLEVMENIGAETQRARDFLGKFLPAICGHLTEKGWLARYVQHVADEPTKVNADSWRAFSDEIKSLAPEMRRIDAVMCDAVAGSIEIWTPLLHYFDKNKEFYQSRVKAGEEVWFYTCLIPRSEYPNRFIDFSLIKTRILHWINLRYGLTGYLHWGYNHWTGNPFSDVEGVQDDGSVLPPGDNAIVYPGKNGPLSSMRWEMLRKGIEDYELLRELSEVRPELAEKIMSDAIPDMKVYVRDPAVFHALRGSAIEALDALAED